MRKLPLQVCLALALSHGLAASSFDDHMTKGRAAIAGGDFSAAEREYRAALREVRRRLGDMRVFLAYEGSRIPRNGSKMCLPQSNTYGTRWRRVGRLASARWQNCRRGSTSSGSTLNTSFGWTARRRRSPRRHLERKRRRGTGGHGAIPECGGLFLPLGRRLRQGRRALPCGAADPRRGQG